MTKLALESISSHLPVVSLSTVSRLPPNCVHRGTPRRSAVLPTRTDCNNGRAPDTFKGIWRSPTEMTAEGGGVGRRWEVSRFRPCGRLEPFGMEMGSHFSCIDGDEARVAWGRLVWMMGSIAVYCNVPPLLTMPPGRGF
jgi:hypothetical protein